MHRDHVEARIRRRSVWIDRRNVEERPTVGGSIVVTTGGGCSVQRRPVRRISERATRPIPVLSKAIISTVNCNKEDGLEIQERTDSKLFVVWINIDVNDLSRILFC